MTTAVAALVLSAAPELRPWELRRLLVRSATRLATDADTAVGAGRISAARALALLAAERTVVGLPAVSIAGDGARVSIAAGVLDTRARADGRQTLDSHLALRVRYRDLVAGPLLESRAAQPIEGIARWELEAPAAERPLRGPLLVEVLDARTGRLLRRQIYELQGERLEPGTTLCSAPTLALLDGDGVSAYPSPFASHTRLGFVLERDATVSLTIFNSRGEEVARLLEEAAIGAGEHSLLFDARGLPSGAYYARLIVGDETRTGEMIFLP